MAQEQKKTHDLREILIQDLNQTEDEELRKVLSHPCVIKYFKNVAFMSLLEQGLSSIQDLEVRDETQHRIRAAYHKGILDCANTVLSFTPRV